MTVTDLFPDNFTRREILQHRASCPYQNLGCTVKVSPVDLDAHILVCHYKNRDNETRKLYCLFRDAGCTAEFNTSEENQDHLSKYMNYHLTVSEKS